MSQRATNSESAQLIPPGKWGRITDINAVLGADSSFILYSGEDTTGAILWAHVTGTAAESVGITGMAVDFDDSGVYLYISGTVEPIIVYGEWGGGMPAAVISGG